MRSPAPQAADDRSLAGAHSLAGLRGVGVTAPSSRIRPGLIVAVAVAAVMFLGIVGLVSVAVFGDDSAPSGAGLERQVDVGQPATVPERLTAETSEVAAAAAEAGGGDADADADADAGDAPPTTLAPSPVTTVPAINEIEAPAPDQELPASGGAPVELPVLVTIPPPPSTFPAVPLAELDASDVAELRGWTLVSQDDGHVAFERDDQIVDIVLADASSAGDALDWFYDRVGADVADLSESPTVRLGAANQPVPLGRRIAVRRHRRRTAGDEHDQWVRTRRRTHRRRRDRDRDQPAGIVVGRAAERRRGAAASDPRPPVTSDVARSTIWVGSVPYAARFPPRSPFGTNPAQIG